MIPTFTFSRNPKILFGPGKFRGLAGFLLPFGRKVLVVTGGSSLDRSGKWRELAEDMEKRSLRYYRISVQGEPSPEYVDGTVSEFRNQGINAVVAIGGGSVMDAGKAVSAMLPREGSVQAYLEGVGDREHDGVKVPFLAVPTTSGTGSETTKNAVLSRVGEAGFKKSLRHDNLVPDIALIDPELTLSCPAPVSAACGMDAFTQLLESYVSSKANPMTDALAWSGLECMKDSLIPVCTSEAGNVEKRAAVAYGALLSGITLANAGLGIVHGLASPVGGFFPAPHGVVCGTLLGAATRINIETLRMRDEAGTPAMEKYARVGALIAGGRYRMEEQGHWADTLADTLDAWTQTLELPRLAEYGIRESDLGRIIEATGNKNNPIKLGADEIRALLLKRL